MKGNMKPPIAAFDNDTFKYWTVQICERKSLFLPCTNSHLRFKGLENHFLSLMSNISRHPRS